MSRRETKMPTAIRDRLFRIRLDSKTDRTISLEDRVFATDCFRRWPKAYKALETEVFDAAAMTVNPMWRPRAKKVLR
jgi:hypothetical protein